LIVYMIRAINNTILITVILNCLMIVALGHAAAPLGMVEFFAIGELVNKQAAFTFNGSSGDAIATASLFSVLGQVLLVIAYMNRSVSRKKLLVYVGLALLFLSLFIAWDEMVITAPFLVVASVLLFLSVRSMTKEKRKFAQ
jgi:hypothetical protein